MDPNTFDTLTRGLAARPTRRGLVAGIAAGLLGAFGLRGAADVAAQATAASCGNVLCRNNPGACKNGCVCCVAPNGNSRCAPPGQCSWGRQVCPPDRPYVDPVRGCVQCRHAAQCPTPGDPCAVAACTNGACRSVAPTAGTSCRAASCANGVATAAATCAGATCPPAITDDCAPYGCNGSVCATTCAGDNDCAPGNHCEGATCVADRANGLPCSGASQCASGFCVGGTCCDTACSGSCETCTGTAAGTCEAIPCPEMRDNVCRSTTGICDGQTGACVYPPLQPGTSCRDSTVAACIQAACDGAGNCIADTTSGCDSECQTCNSGTNTCENVESFPPPEMRISCDGGKGYCTDGACDYPCGVDCTDHCYDRYSVSEEWRGAFCCKNNLDGNGNCCWIDDNFGVVGEDGVCRRPAPRCCDDTCCENPGTCFCSFGRISRCC